MTPRPSKNQKIERQGLQPKCARRKPKGNKIDPKGCNIHKHCMREGITVPSHRELEACRLEAKLCTMGLTELCVDAVFFYQAIGELDDPF